MPHHNMVALAKSAVLAAYGAAEEEVFAMSFGLEHTRHGVGRWPSANGSIAYSRVVRW
jgi:hypothetical protein